VTLYRHLNGASHVGHTGAPPLRTRQGKARPERISRVLALDGQLAG